MTIDDWLDPQACPAARPPMAHMAERTRMLHEGIDSHIRRCGVPYLHPDSPTLQLDMLSSREVRAWQEGKAQLLFMGEGCWAELPQLYARYGTTAGAELIKRVRELEAAPAAVLTDCGMQATALAFDALMTPGAHAICMRQVYNKTRSYLERLAERLGGDVSIVDDGDHDALAAAVRPETVLLFAETFTNPLMRAQDPHALSELARDARKVAPGLRVVIDNTIATPWGLTAPLLASDGIDVVVASGTKALGGQDRDMWGYVASTDMDFANAVMDLVALRGGNLDWRRSTAILQGLEAAEKDHARRCETATRLAAFLARSPSVECVYHPSLPSHPDRSAIDTAYQRFGSIVSLRVKGADEAKTRHLADALATTTVVRYALSFDGPTTKVNHHQTVSEYFTPPARLEKSDLHRLIRIGVGIENADDVIAAVNWMLHHGADVTSEQLGAWRVARAADLGRSSDPG